MIAALPVSPLIEIEVAQLRDLDTLCTIENTCFATDQLSRRRLKFYLSAPHACLEVVKVNGDVVGYGLLLMRRGTQLTRLYSLAVLPSSRGLGLAEMLINTLAAKALERGKRFMRLEVSESNKGAIALYRRLGFTQFGVYEHYYADETDALRMQKVLKPQMPTTAFASYPWYQQTTAFTCGPASLMMAMAATMPEYQLSAEEELAIWREATTIFMTSGHGGCHPIGLALSAWDRGFDARVYLNRSLPLFVDGVRSEHKKSIITRVEDAFLESAMLRDLPVYFDDWRIDTLEQALEQGAGIICLISTYHLDQKKAPHWVVLTGTDSHCWYMHEPDPDPGMQRLECQHIPIAKDDFIRMASYGRRKIRAAVVIRPSVEKRK